MSEFKRVHLTIEYITPACPEGEDKAREMICDDIASWTGGDPQELWWAIKIEDAPNRLMCDVSDHILEYLKEDDDG